MKTLNVSGPSNIFGPQPSSLAVGTSACRTDGFKPMPVSLHIYGHMVLQVLFYILTLVKKLFGFAHKMHLQNV